MRVLIIGEQPVYCEGLAAIIARLDAEAELSMAIGPDALAKAQPDAADLFLVEVIGPGNPARMEVLRRLAQSPQGRVVVFSDRDTPCVIRETMELGVRGFVPKSLNVNLVLNALRMVEMGGRYVPDTLLVSRQEGFAEAPEAFFAGGYKNHAASARGARRTRPRPLQSGNRARARHFGRHRQAACECDPSGARCAQPHGGGHHRIAGASASREHTCLKRMRASRMRVVLSFAALSFAAPSFTRPAWAGERVRICFQR